MLESLVARNEANSVLYGHLKEMKFIPELVRCLNECQSNGDEISRVALLRLLARCLENPKLRSLCMEPSVFAAATAMSDDSAPDVLKWQWRAIELYAAFHPMNYELFLNSAFTILVQLVHAPVMESFQVSAVNFISATLKVTPAVIRGISVLDLAQTLKLLCEKFSEHGIALQAISRLIVVAVHTPETADVFVDLFVPAIAEWIATKFERRLLYTFAVDCARKIEHRTEVDTELTVRIERCPIFAQQCKPEVCRYEDILFRAFGGKSPVKRSES
jgi:hypothetical protein